ncbi:MAG TPA: MFS transporter [Alphaproteobacteria bacterium]|nr:MFS transporter [Alphaproteobacteria bacterium]
MANVLIFGAVILSAALLNAGNGLIQTLLPIRLTVEGFSASASGVMLAGHAVGFLVGCLGAPGAIQRVGHIRVFAAAAAILAITSLAFSIAVDTLFWTLLRLATGFASAAMFTALESWLNAGTTRDIRGSVMGVYMVAGKVALIAGQLMLTLPFEPMAIFMLGSAVYSLCLIPMAMTQTPSPDVSRIRPISLKEIYAIAPAGLAGCLAAGLVNSAVAGLAPVYATQINLPRELAAVSVSALQFGTLLLQWPLGRVSDRFDRRRVIVTIGAVSAAASIALLFGPALPVWLLFVLFAAWGGFALSIYAVSIAHANDLAHRDQLVSLSSGLLMVWAFGSMMGPVIGAGVMEVFGPSGLFGYAGAMYVLLTAFIVWRMTARRGVPADRQIFVDVPTTTPMAARLAHAEAPDTPAERAHPPK